MNKTLLKILVVCMLVFSALCVFTACGETQEKHEHSYTSSHVDPTCEEQGGTKYVCSCGDFYWENVVPALGHNPSAEWTMDKQATCTETGVKSRHCLTCGKHLVETEIPLLPHNIEDGVCTICHQRFSADGLTYALNNTETEYSVTGIGTFKGSALYVPQMYNNLPVTGIAAYAFNQQTQLTSVNIPKSIKSIGDYAFNGCVNITRIEFDASSCSDFEENNNVFSYVGQSQNGTTVAIGKNVVKIPAYFLYSNTKTNAAPKVKEINFDNATSLKRINEYAFAGCTALKSLKISDNVTTIEYGAFYGCSYLQDITLPFVGQLKQYSEYDSPMYRSFAYTFSPLEFNGYTFIGGYGAEYVPSSLKTVVVTLSEPSAAAFSGCTDIENVVIKNAEKINDSLFYGCSSLKSVEIPDTVEEIGSSAFYGCSSLKSVEIPDTVEEIGASAFYGCSKLETFIFPEELKIIKGSAFARCSRLAELSFNDKLEEIEGLAFERCVAIKEILLPTSLNNIGAGAFKGCLYIEKITLDFIGTEREITGSYGAKNLFGAIFSNSNVEYDYTKTEEEQPEFHTYKITQKYNDGNSAEFWLPKTLTTIIYNGRELKYGAFSGLSEVTEITLSSNLNEIGDYVFNACSGLINIVIPDSVMSIGNYVFSDCTGLKTITVGRNNANYGSSEGILYNKGKTEIIYVPLNITGEITIPERVTVIQDGAFENRISLTSVHITENVKSIGKNAFNGCTALNSVKFDNANCWEYGPSFAQNKVGEIAVEDFEDTAKIATFLKDRYTGYMWYRAVYITIDQNDNAAGSVEQSARKVDIGTEISITAATNNGYTFVGWYNGDALLTRELSYTFTIDEQDVIYTAKWSKVALSVNNSSAGSVTNLNGKYKYGDNVTITATTNIGYTFIGWYNGDTLLTRELSHVFTMPSENVTYTANFEVKAGMENFNFSSTTEWCHIIDLKNTSISTVIIPDYVTSIGEYAFINRSSLTSITIPNSVTRIGDWAFNNCSSLTSVTIGDSVTSIGENAFYGCPIENATIPALAISYIPKSSLETVIITSGNSIGEYAFRGCSNLTSVTIPDSVTSIGNGAFSSCSSLESITIPFVGGSKSATSASSSTLFGYIFGTSSYTGGTETQQYFDDAIFSTYTIYYIPSTLKSVTVTGGYILYGAFYNCSSLTSVTISDTTTTSIGRYVFYNCSGLTNITIPDSVTSIGYYAFNLCNKLQYNEYGNGYYLGNANNPYVVLVKAKSTSITSCKINDNTKVIYDYAFYSCSSLTSITIPDSVTSIGVDAFRNCRKMSLNISENNENYKLIDGIIYSRDGKTLVQYVITPTTFIIPDSVTSIWDYAFYRCRSLTEVTIPDSVTSIGSYAFYGCSNLTEVTIPDSVTSIGDQAFGFCSGLTSVTIGNDVTSIGKLAFSGCSSLTEVTIPDSVTSIGDRAFYNCSSLTSVIIGSSVKSIGDHAFYDCSSLTEVTIPDSVTNIGDQAFRFCSGLTSVTIGNDVTSIGKLAFSGCSSLTSIIFNDSTTWYTTTYSDYTHGTRTNVANASTNAMYFTSTYSNYYWFKQ